MKQREILLLFFIIFCLTMQAIVYAQGASKVEIYFNAATEEYLRSNFSKAAENLEKALELKAENKKIKDFLVKILYEAGEYFYLKRNYHSAYNYLEKAKKYAKDIGVHTDRTYPGYIFIQKPELPPCKCSV